MTWKDGFLCRDGKDGTERGPITFVYNCKHSDICFLEETGIWVESDTCTASLPWEDWTVEEFIKEYGKKNLPRKRTITPCELEL